MYSALQVSRKIDYALRAVIYLAEQPEGAVMSFRHIAAKEKVPKDFLAKILRQLVDGGVMTSTRGAHGGYSLARTPSEISFLEVIEAVDGPVNLNVCLGDHGECAVQGSCSMLGVWRRAQEAMLDVFRTTSIEDVLRSDPVVSPLNPVDAFLAGAQQPS